MLKITGNKPPFGFKVVHYVAWEPEPWLREVYLEILDDTIDAPGTSRTQAIVLERSGKKINRSVAIKMLANAKAWADNGGRWPEMAPSGKKAHNTEPTDDLGLD